MEDNIRILYDQMKLKGMNVPDYDTFQQTMNTDAGRRAVHKGMQDKGYNVPDYDTFNTTLGGIPQVQPEKAKTEPEVEPLPAVEPAPKQEVKDNIPETYTAVLPEQPKGEAENIGDVGFDEWSKMLSASILGAGSDEEREKYIGKSYTDPDGNTWVVNGVTPNGLFGLTSIGNTDLFGFATKDEKGEWVAPETKQYVRGGDGKFYELSGNEVQTSLFSHKIEANLDPSIPQFKPADSEGANLDGVVGIRTDNSRMSPLMQQMAAVNLKYYNSALKSDPKAVKSHIEEYANLSDEQLIAAYKSIQGRKDATTEEILDGVNRADAMETIAMNRALGRNKPEDMLGGFDAGYELIKRDSGSKIGEAISGFENGIYSGSYFANAVSGEIASYIAKNFDSYARFYGDDAVEQLQKGVERDVIPGVVSRLLHSPEAAAYILYTEKQGYSPEAAVYGLIGEVQSGMNESAFNAGLKGWANDLGWIQRADIAFRNSAIVSLGAGVMGRLHEADRVKAGVISSVKPFDFGSLFGSTLGILFDLSATGGITGGVAAGGTGLVGRGLASVAAGGLKGASRAAFMSEYARALSSTWGMRALAGGLNFATFNLLTGLAHYSVGDVKNISDVAKSTGEGALLGGIILPGANSFAERTLRGVGNDTAKGIGKFIVEDLTFIGWEVAKHWVQNGEIKPEDIVTIGVNSTATLIGLKLPHSFDKNTSPFKPLDKGELKSLSELGYKELASYLSNPRKYMDAANSNGIVLFETDKNGNSVLSEDSALFKELSRLGENCGRDGQPTVAEAARAMGLATGKVVAYEGEVQRNEVVKSDGKWKLLSYGSDGRLVKSAEFSSEKSARKALDTYERLALINRFNTAVSGYVGSHFANLQRETVNRIGIQSLADNGEVNGRRIAVSDDGMFTYQTDAQGRVGILCEDGGYIFIDRDGNLIGTDAQGNETKTPLKTSDDILSGYFSASKRIAEAKAKNEEPDPSDVETKKRFDDMMEQVSEEPAFKNMTAKAQIEMLENEYGVKFDELLSRDPSKSKFTENEQKAIEACVYILNVGMPNDAFTYKATLSNGETAYIRERDSASLDNLNENSMVIYVTPDGTVRTCAGNELSNVTPIGVDDPMNARLQNAQTELDAIVNASKFAYADIDARLAEVAKKNAEAAAEHERKINDLRQRMPSVRLIGDMVTELRQKGGDIDGLLADNIEARQREIDDLFSQRKDAGTEDAARIDEKIAFLKSEIQQIEDIKARGVPRGGAENGGVPRGQGEPPAAEEVPSAEEPVKEETPTDREPEPRGTEQQGTEKEPEVPQQPTEPPVEPTETPTPPPTEPAEQPVQQGGEVKEPIALTREQLEGLDGATKDYLLDMPSGSYDSSVSQEEYDAAISDGYDAALRYSRGELAEKPEDFDRYAKVFNLQEPAKQETLPPAQQPTEQVAEPVEQPAEPEPAPTPTTFSGAIYPKNSHGVAVTTDKIHARLGDEGAFTFLEGKEAALNKSIKDLNAKLQKAINRGDEKSVDKIMRQIERGERELDQIAEIREYRSYEYQRWLDKKAAEKEKQDDIAMLRKPIAKMIDWIESRYGEAGSIEDFVKREFALGHVQLRWNGDHGVQAETGMSSGERKRWFGILSKDGMSVETAAEALVKQLPDRLFEYADSQDVRNMLIDILMSYGSRRELVTELYEKYRQREQEYELNMRYKEEFGVAEYLADMGVIRKFDTERERSEEWIDENQDVIGRFMREHSDYQKIVNDHLRAKGEDPYYDEFVPSENEGEEFTPSDNGKPMPDFNQQSTEVPFDRAEPPVREATQREKDTVEAIAEELKGFGMDVELSPEGQKVVDEVEGKDGMKSHRVAPVFYSNAERAVEGVKQEKATGAQWKAMLSKNGGIKAGEDKWTGLSDWLDEHSGETLTKEQVLAFIAENGVKMVEREYIEAPYSFESLKREYDQWLHDEGFDYAQEQLLERFGDDARIAFDDLGGELVIANEEAAAALLGSEDIINSTRLDYTTEGLDNKREIAFVVPGVEPYQESDAVHFGPENEGRAVMWVRFGETTDADGNRVLVIDEIQSNRHQDAREKGYKDNALTQRLNEAENELLQTVEEYKEFAKGLDEKYGGSTNWNKSVREKKAWGTSVRFVADESKLSQDEYLEWKELYEKVQLLRNNIGVMQHERLMQKGVPSAPFEKNWHEVAMKRMLRLAAEEGFDKVAWTTGEQQARRYDIGNVVKRVVSEPYEAQSPSESNGHELFLQLNDGTIHEMFVQPDGTLNSNSEMFDGKNVREVFGKELGEKIATTTERTELEGDGLRIGGEGMKGFYDKMLPRFMDKYGKKWGVKTDTVELPNVEEAGRTMHSVDVTDEMKASVREGQPMFFRTSAGEVYGFTYKGKIYLDPKIARPETPIHEYTHLWAEAYRKRDPEGWEKIVELMRGQKDLWERVKKNYPELKTDSELADEVLAHYSGKRGAERLNKEMDEIKRSDMSVSDKAAAIDGLHRIKAALERFWRGVAESFGWEFTTAEEVADRVLYDLTRGYDPRKHGAEGETMKKMFVGEQGAENLDKADNGTRMADRDIAERMEGEGKDARAIKFATGWERGADGKWRWESMDLKLNNEEFLKFVQHEGTAIYWDKLGNLVSDNELFKAYPELRDVTIYSNTDGDNSYNPKHNEIAIDISVIWSNAMQRDFARMSEERQQMEYCLSRAEAAKDSHPHAAEDYKAWAEDHRRAIDEIQEKIDWMRRVLNNALVHEIQHKVQEIEGFAKGGSPRDFGESPDIFVVGRALFEKQIADKLIEDGDTVETLREKYEARKGKDDADSKAERGVLAEAMQWLHDGYSPQDVREQYTKDADRLWDMYHDDSPTSARGQYERLAGEVEARNASKRMGMTRDERRGSLATDTEDVPRGEQIVHFGGGVNSSEASSIDDIVDKEFEETFENITYPELRSAESAVLQYGKKTKKNEYRFIFTADYFYLYTQEQIGSPKLHIQLNIEKNQSLINSIIQSINKNGKEGISTIRDTGGISSVINRAKSASNGYYRGDVGDAERQLGNGEFGGMDSERTARRYGDNDLAGRIPEREQGQVQGEQESNSEEANITQGFGSAATSLNQTASAFGKIKWQQGTVNVDIGGGKYDKATEYLRERGVENLVFDPFNRDAEHNRAVAERVRNERADTVTCNNVLNVIDSEGSRANVILQAARALKPDGTAYFSVYEGDKSGVGRQTKSDSWQNNRPIRDYVSEVERYFDDVTLKNGVITARKPKATNEQSVWDFDGSYSGNSIRFSRVSRETDADFEKAVADGNTKKVANLVMDAAKQSMPDTKVVDRWGKPRVMFHGTPSEKQFYVFKDGDIFLTSGESSAGEYTHYRRALSTNPAQTGRVMPCFVNLVNPYIVDARRHLWRNIDVDWSDSPVDTHAISKYAKEHGYDGVIVKHVRDHMYDDDYGVDDVVIAFDKSQVKSAGPTYEMRTRTHFPWDEHEALVEKVGATYDDEGNLIPLSQRFDFGKNDIRFSRVGDERALAEVGVEAAKIDFDAEKAQARKAKFNKFWRGASAQRTFDRATTEEVKNFANDLMTEFGIDPTRGMAKRLLSNLHAANGRKEVRKQVQAIADMVLGAAHREAKETWEKLLATKAPRLDSNGLRVQGRVDELAQQTLETTNRYLGSEPREINSKIRDVEDQLSDPDISPERREELYSRYGGLLLAKEYREQVRPVEEALNELTDQMTACRKRMAEDKRKHDANEISDAEYKKLREQENEKIDALRDSAIEVKERLVEGYNRLSGSLGGDLAAGHERAKEWVEERRAHDNEIYHNANSDLLGVPDTTTTTDKQKARDRKKSEWYLPLAPLRTFEQFMRFFGKKDALGEGYLFSRFVSGDDGSIMCDDREWREKKSAWGELDAKAKELFNVKRWSDAMKLANEGERFTLTYRNGNNDVTVELTQGQMAYIYALEKQADGRVKLRSMNITEDKVAAITDALDKNVKAAMDWLQSDFLPRKRELYNEVYKRLYGVSMAENENYFPIKIDQGFANTELSLDNIDLNSTTSLPGAIRERVQNNKPIELKDAFDVTLSHIDEMTDFWAWAEFRRDLTTLLNYKKFERRVKNMRSPRFGSGENLWQNFVTACEIASGLYKPEHGYGLVPKVASNFTAAAIALRIHTAIKQLASYPAFLADANVAEFVKNIPLNIPKMIDSWKWAMEELPGFSRRWQSRMAGNEKLTDLMYGSDFVKKLKRGAILPNAAVDAITVACGAHAVYKTKYKYYKKAGFSEDMAKKKALRDAAISYNSSQQSANNTFLSKVQKDRDLGSIAVTTFRNGPMGYNRRFLGGVTGLYKYATQNKSEVIDYMAKKAEREGLSEDDARRFAKRRYRYGLVSHLITTSVFGYITSLAWDAMGHMGYYFLGGDDEKKKDLWREDLWHGALGGIEGLSYGNVVSDLVNSAFITDGDIKDDIFETLPLGSQLKNFIKTWGKDDDLRKVWETSRLFCQSFTGVDPGVITDMLTAIYDKTQGNTAAFESCAMLVARLFNTPQRMLDEIYIDELKMSGREARKLTPEQIAERFARYKLMKENPLTVFIDEDEREKRYQTYVNRLKNKAVLRADLYPVEEVEKWLNDPNIDPLEANIYLRSLNNRYTDMELEHLEKGYREASGTQSQKKQGELLKARLKESSDSELEAMLDDEDLRMRSLAREELNRREKAKTQSVSEYVKGLTQDDLTYFIRNEKDDERKEKLVEEYGDRLKVAKDDELVSLYKDAYTFEERYEIADEIYNRAGVESPWPSKEKVYDRIYINERTMQDLLDDAALRAIRNRLKTTDEARFKSLEKVYDRINDHKRTLGADNAAGVMKTIRGMRSEALKEYGGK